MSDNAGAVQPATSADHPALSKPEPPEDMWARLDAVMEEVKVLQAWEHPGSDWFTRLEFEQRYSLTRGVAKHRLDLLMKAGKLERRGVQNKGFFYRLKPSEDELQRLQLARMQRGA